jgi:anthranilate phosphoribosyltransferase
MAIVQRVLNNEPGPARDIVLLNAGAAIYAANVASTLADGVDRAREALASGRAAQALNQFVQTTQKLAAEQA